MTKSHIQLKPLSFVAYINHEKGAKVQLQVSVNKVIIPFLTKYFRPSKVYPFVIKIPSLGK